MNLILKDKDNTDFADPFQKTQEYFGYIKTGTDIWYYDSYQRGHYEWINNYQVLSQYVGFEKLVFTQANELDKIMGQGDFKHIRHLEITYGI